MPHLSSFRIFRILKTKRGPIIRGVTASLGWIATALLTGQTSLAALSARQFWQGDILQGARRIAWLARRGRLQLPIGKQDHAFDFTDAVTPHQLDQTAAFLLRHSARNTARIRTTDALFIAARKYAQGSTQRQDFVQAAQNLLDVMPSIAAVTLRDPPHMHTQLSGADAAQALHDCATLLQNTPWFVLSGTFLGLIREGGFLAHDYDIDIGVMHDVPLADIQTRLQNSTDFVLRKVDIQPAYGALANARPMLLKLVHRTGVPVDVFYHYDTPDGRTVHGSSLHHWFNTPFTLRDYSLEGVTVQGPADADRYLTENYGDWRTPVIDFDCSTDTPNLAIVKHPSNIAMFLQRLSYFADIGHPTLPKLVAELTHEGIIAPKGGHFVLGDNLLD